MNKLIIIALCGLMSIPCVANGRETGNDNNPSGTTVSCFTTGIVASASDASCLRNYSLLDEQSIGDISTFSISRAQSSNHEVFELCRGDKTTVAKKRTIKSVEENLYLQRALEKSFSPLAVSLGLGIDFRVSRDAFNFGFPIEVRLLPPSAPFSFRIGERISIHEGGRDSSDYYDPYFRRWLWKPTLGFTQFSTYCEGRWNFLHFSQKDALYVGVGYYFNVNTQGRVYLDIPNVAFINNQYVWDASRHKTTRYWFDDLLKPVSHTLKIEVGVEASFMELSMFCTFDLVKPYELSALYNNVNYDIEARDRNIYTGDPHPGDNRYVASNFSSFREIDHAIHDLCYFGMALKFYIFGGAWDR